MHHPQPTATATTSITTTVSATDDEQPHLTTADHSLTLPPSSNYPSKPKINGSKLTKKNRKRAPDDATSASSSSSSSIMCSHHHQKHSLRRGIVIPSKRRNPRFSIRRSASDAEAIAFPLGMSIAAVLAQVLERKDLMNDNVSVDHLAMTCTSAVRESLSNVFGDKFDAFARNFEKSFASTLNTLRLIKSSNQNFDNDLNDFARLSSPNKGECSSRCGDKSDLRNRVSLDSVEELEDDQFVDSENRELSLPRNMNMQSYLRNQSMLTTMEKSIVEQTRANDLKRVEIGLKMRELKLKETQLAINSDLNFLERCKLSVGISRTSFKVEKFKSQLEEARHSELLRTCADFLVADLLIMLVCLGYGVYAFSYDKIYQLTKSCSPPSESKSWWVPKPMASFNSALQTLSCQVQVYSRMLFGFLMILAIAYVLFQRSVIATSAMPITFIVLLLGAGCGIAGKFCVDTLGGDGYKWLIFWEFLCVLHFIANVFTPLLFYILNGRIRVAPEPMMSRHVLFPYWTRRWLFYLVLGVAPICCGLLPFASPRKWWEDHFSNLIRNHLFASSSDGENFDDGGSGFHG